MGRSPYWLALGISHLLGWVMLGLACELVPHSWQDRKKTGTGTRRGWLYAWRYGGMRWRERRRKLLEHQPVAWLTGRERWQSLVVWTMAMVAVGGLATVLLRQTPREVWIIWGYLGGLFTLVLYLWTASQASQFLLEARRSGLLELLLASPLKEKEIVRGQWRAWLRLFGWPVLLLLSVHVTAVTLSQLSFQNLATQVNTATTLASTNQSGTVTNRVVSGGVTISVTSSSGTNAVTVPASVRPGSRAQEVAMAAGAAVAAALCTLANLLALCWFGMWMGLTSRSANLATLKTILFVQVIPWMVIAFGSGIVVGVVLSRWFTGLGATQAGNWVMWWPLLNAVFTAGLAIVKDIAFISWSRKWLYSSLREQAARSFEPPPLLVPPPLPKPIAPPPVLAAPR